MRTASEAECSGYYSHGDGGRAAREARARIEARDARARAANAWRHPRPTPEIPSPIVAVVPTTRRLVEFDADGESAVLLAWALAADGEGRAVVERLDGAGRLVIYVADSDESRFRLRRTA